jgi:hypothetical protein
MRRLLLFAGAAATLGAAAFTTAAPAFAWQSVIEGKPASLEAGSLHGVYFWHDDAGLNLSTTDAHDNGHLYKGTLTTDGAFNSLEDVHLEDGDSATIVSPTQLDFSFNTFNAIDGIRFRIDGGAQISLDLTVDGHAERADNVFLGAYSQHPDTNPFTVTRAGGGPTPPPPGENPIIGRPKALDAGSAAGAYFWKEDGLHLATTDPENVEHHYSGTVQTDGSVTDVQPVKFEGDDTFAVTGENNDTLDFDFHTFSGVDGVGFRVKGGSYAIVTLYRDGNPLPIDHIFLGAYSQHPDTDPFSAQLN